MENSEKKKIGKTVTTTSGKGGTILLGRKGHTIGEKKWENAGADWFEHPVNKGGLLGYLKAQVVKTKTREIPMSKPKVRHHQWRTGEVPGRAPRAKKGNTKRVEKAGKGGVQSRGKEKPGGRGVGKKKMVAGGKGGKTLKKFTKWQKKKKRTTEMSRGPLREIRGPCGRRKPRGFQPGDETMRVAG